MDEHALRVLEYPKLKEQLVRYTLSPLGREAVEELHPFTFVEEVRLSLCEVSEMVLLYQKNNEPSLDGIYDIREPLKKSAVAGSMLEPAELIVIGETVAAARRIRTSLKNNKEEIPHIRHYGNLLIPHPDIESAMGRVFDERGQIRDTASRELARVRKSIHRKREMLVSRIERLMRGSWKEYLQEMYYTHREGRYVMPVDARYQNHVKGIIHDRSATGTTVFIEPLELVEDGNHLKELHREEEIEIRKILLEITALITSHRDELSSNLEIIRQLDLISAKARFSLKYLMNEPIVKESGPISIINGRHPLLLAQHSREEVVPLNVTMPPDVRGIVVTGPNTGGKTVVLKTVGILVLMAQSGLHIPADETTEIPVYSYVGSDIGDEQSLEQSLSTFSSHMKNIRTLLERANSSSLILLDELGSGTDPIEGGALSTAILRQFHRQGATYLVTTHLSDLKLFAHTTYGVENGAMEYDLGALRPTFKFRLGLPGQSNAIRIADRLGLPQPIIEQARTEREEKGDSPEELLNELGKELQTARSVRLQAGEELEKARHINQESENRLHKAKGEAREVIRRSERKAQGLIQELERQLRALEKKEREYQLKWQEKLSQLVECTTRTAPPETILKTMRGELESAKRQIERAVPADLEKREKREDWSMEQLIPGAQVRIAGFSGKGVIRSVWTDNNEVEVTINSMNLRINADRILAVNRPEKFAENIYTGITVERPEAVENHLDVHGMTVDEMTPVVQKYVDQAFRSGTPAVTIIHGYGTGILRRAVRSLLSENPVVKNYKNGADFEGGAGVTVVQFRSDR